MKVFVLDKGGETFPAIKGERYDYAVMPSGERKLISGLFGSPFVYAIINGECEYGKVIEREDLNSVIME